MPGRIPSVRSVNPTAGGNRETAWNCSGQLDEVPIILRPEILGSVGEQHREATVLAGRRELDGVGEDLGSRIDGEAYDGDPREIELGDHREIAIVIGSAPDEIPSEFPQ